MDRIAVVTILIGLCAGCLTGTETPRYYTLEMKPSGKVQPNCNLQVDRIRPAEMLARNNILIRKSPTEIEYYAIDQWAAGLDEVVTQKLEVEFGEPAANRKTLLLSGTVIAFEQVDTANGAQAHIKLMLEFRNEAMQRYDKPLLEKTYEITQDARSASPRDVVVALSTSLEELAVRIITDANAL